MTDSQPALARAIQIAGGQLPLARKIGASQSSVWEWLNRSRRGVPAEWAGKIEEVTGIGRHELRPDVFPDPALQHPHAAKLSVAGASA